MRIPVAPFALALLLSLAPRAEAEIYRYTDANGAEHFTMDLGKVPAPYREQAARNAEEGARRIQIIAPRWDSRLDPKSEPANLRWPPSTPPSAPSAASSEQSWRNRFAFKRKSIAKAERELERAETANRPIRAGHSSSARSAQSRWARQEYRKQKAEERMEAAETGLEAAEDAMHRLRQQATDAKAGFLAASDMLFAQDEEKEADRAFQSSDYSGAIHRSVGLQHHWWLPPWLGHTHDCSSEPAPKSGVSSP